MILETYFRNLSKKKNKQTSDLIHFNHHKIINYSLNGYLCEHYLCFWFFFLPHLVVILQKVLEKGVVMNITAVSSPAEMCPMDE